METNYYRVLGGTLTVSDQTYVRRRADEQLYKFLTTLVDQINRPCFILAPRQTGKSSLMNQASFQLEQQGKICARINLQRLGQSLTQDELYFILLRETCKQINLVEWFDEAWQNNPVGIPITLAFQEVAEKLLEQLSNQRLILFLDEIQQLTYWNLQNSFLGLMKALAGEEKLKNLTFVLLGVAKPSDLITDSAFALNVAYSIELGNLTLENCEPLLPGLKDVYQNPQEVLEMILKWTGGQPFLTQVVCALVANQLKLEKNANLEEEIEKLIEGEIIKDWRRNDPQSHFHEIESRFRRISPNNKQEKLKALSLYRDIWNERRVQFKSESGAQMELLISGLVVKSEGDGLLKVANPIYQRIFNRDWIESTQQFIISQLDELLKEMKDLLKNFGSAVDSVMLVDGLGDVQLFYPDESLKTMGNVTASSIGEIESQIKLGLKQPFVVQQMEIVTQDKRILTLKMSEDSDYFLCFVCLKNNKKLGLLKSAFEQTFKSRMISAMEKPGIINGDKL